MGRSPYGLGVERAVEPMEYKEVEAYQVELAMLQYKEVEVHQLAEPGKPGLVVR